MPTIVRVVRNATAGIIPSPALVSVPIRGKAIKAGINVMVPNNAEIIVAKSKF